MIKPNEDPFALAKELSGYHLIDGALVPAISGTTFDVVNPATGAVIGQAAAGDAQDVDVAVASAKAAQLEWQRRSARERGRLITECGRILENHVEELGRLVALESGKALRTESRVEASILADTFAYFGGLGSELKGETIPYSPNSLTMTLREPVGVVGAIIPWNVPIPDGAQNCAGARRRNTVVVKSSEEASLCCLRVCQLGPDSTCGRVQYTQRRRPVCGGPVAAHDDVAKISFTVPLKQVESFIVRLPKSSSPSP